MHLHECITKETVVGMGLGRIDIGTMSWYQDIGRISRVRDDKEGIV